jgi:hypothetical protein
MKGISFWGKTNQACNYDNTISLSVGMQNLQILKIQLQTDPNPKLMFIWYLYLLVSGVEL